eukprot:3339226-Pyramimonas_sp.AAC.1
MCHLRWGGEAPRPLRCARRQPTLIRGPCHAFPSLRRLPPRAKALPPTEEVSAHADLRDRPCRYLGQPLLLTAASDD